MDPTCGLVDKVWDLVLGQIQEQLLYLVCYHRNIKQFNEQLEALIVKRISIEDRVDEVTNKGDKVDARVNHWLSKVDGILAEVQKLHEKSRAKTEHGMASCPSPWLRYKLSKRAKVMAKEMSEICKEEFDKYSYRGPLELMLELTNRESNERIGSRTQIVNQIMEQLHNPSVNIVGLCGHGGVGKTTIAEEVAMKAKNQNMFKRVIMATISNELNVEKVQGRIARMLGMQLDDKSEEERACHLHARLKQEENMLLILDDLWKKEDLVNVGIPIVGVGNYSKENEGRKILLTSRNRMLLLNHMKRQEIIEVDVLSEDEAWKLFKTISELPIDPDLMSMAYQIVRKCEGLPLAIATAAKALRGKSPCEWQDYCARLNHPLRRNITGIKEVDDILKLSYDPPSQENKNIFLLSAMLSYDPSIEDLLMYSVGLDILEGIEDIENAHAGISAAISKLKSLNLFLDSFSSHCFTIHDVFRDVALSIAPNELNAFIVRHRSLKEWPDKNKLEDYKGICLQKSDISDLPEELPGPRLEFFLLDSRKRDLAIPRMFFKSSKELKVLAFTNVHFSSLPSLMFLQRLKTLCLHSCLLEDIIEVRSLTKLKVLSLAYSEIQQLPIELAELTSLQMLNLAHCSKLKVIPPKLLSGFKKLEALCMENSFDQWKVKGSTETNENASLDELKGLPICSLDIHIPNVFMLPENLFLDMNLMRYKILIGKRWKWNVNYESSKILKLELESNVHLKPGVRKLMKGAEDLCLYGSNGLENVLHGHDGRSFPHLRHLQIESNDTIESIVLNSAHHEAATNNTSNKMSESRLNKVLLPKLEILRLSNLINLSPLIWDGHLSHNSFRNLKTLFVENCGCVKLVPLRVLKSLNNLEELEVRDCDMLELVFDFEDLNDYKEAESSSVIVPLKKLTLCGLRKLKNVWSNHYEGNVSFPSLSSVHVSYCESLTSLFPASIAKGMLRDLEYLRIEHCGIEVIVAKDQVSESVATVLEFPRLTSLQLSSLQNLKSFYPQRHTLEWPQLQQLGVTYCGKLEIFEKEVSSSLEIHEEESTIDSKYPLLSHAKVTHNLEELTLFGKGAEVIGSGQLSTYRFPKVKLLHLDVGYYNATAISISYKLLKSFPNLEELRLQGHIKEISGGDDVPLPIKLTLDRISNITNLVPLLVSSSNLTHLHVISCDGLTTLMTSSVARSLVHLTSLSISSSYQMKEIIWKQEGEDDDDVEVVFSKLQYLELKRLPRLKRFCGYNYSFRFPLLDQLIITECLKFKVFSPGLIDTPSLKSVQLSQWGEKHHEIWDTNLKKTFYQRFAASRKMVLDEYDVSMIRNDQFPAADCFAQMEILGIEGFDDEGATFPYTVLERFPQLNELHVNWSSFEEIFPSPIVHQIQQLRNLTVLKVSVCDQLIYLMTNSAAKSLVNLERLEIDNCRKMEEIVKNENNEDVEGGITFSALRILELTNLPRLKAVEDKADFNNEGPAANNSKVSFPKLEILRLYSLNSLIPPIWYDKPSLNSFGNLKTLTVSTCGIVKLMPLHVLRYLNNLEELQVRECKLLETVFYFEDLNDYKEIVSSSMEPSLYHQNQIEEIIARQEEEDDEDTEIIFSKLELLELDGLPRLKRFCSQNYTLKFPLLQCLTITECPQLRTFCSGAIHAPQLQNVRVKRAYEESEDSDIDIWMTDLNATIQRRFTIPEVISTTESMALTAKNITMIRDVFPEVTTLYVESFKDEGVTFPYSSLEKFPKLNNLYVEHSSFEQVFPAQDEIINFRGKIPPFKKLHIAYLDQLKSIWKDDSQLPPKHQDLITRLEVESCHSLVKLVPSSALFQNLWKLSISGCHQLVYLVTCSTAKSLVSLRWLWINNCKKMEEVVLNENNEGVQGGITFNELLWIKLTDMPSLTMFSSQSQTFEFPGLYIIEITRCPEMKVFCPGVLETPELSRVKIEEHEVEWKDKGDLNKTVEMLSSAKDNVNV